MKLDLSRCLCVYSSKYEMEANTKKMLGREIRKFQDILYRHMPFTLCVCVCVCVCVCGCVAALHGLWDLSSPSRDRTHDPCSGSEES